MWNSKYTVVIENIIRSEGHSVELAATKLNVSRDYMVGLIEGRNLLSKNMYSKFIKVYSPVENHAMLLREYVLQTSKVGVLSYLAEEMLRSGKQFEDIAKSAGIPLQELNEITQRVRRINYEQIANILEFCEARVPKNLEQQVKAYNELFSWTYGKDTVSVVRGMTADEIMLYKKS